MAKAPDGPPSSRLSRLRKLAGLGAQLGGDALSRGVKRLAGADPSSLSTGTAEKLVETLGDLKGAAMKLGQVASMDPDLFPPEVRAIFARLQNEAPPMPFERVAAVIEDELGAARTRSSRSSAARRWRPRASARCTARVSTTVARWW